MSETKYISEIISEKEIVTRENQNILITAPTGAGKSYFIKNKLYDYALANNKKILYLLPRLDTVLQFRDEIQRDRKTDVKLVFSEFTGEISSIRSYLITALFNSVATCDIYFAQRVQHDMYGEGEQQ